MALEPRGSAGAVCHRRPDTRFRRLLPLVPHRLHQVARAWRVCHMLEAVAGPPPGAIGLAKPS